MYEEGGVQKNLIRNHELSAKQRGKRNPVNKEPRFFGLRFRYLDAHIAIDGSSIA